MNWVKLGQKLSLRKKIIGLVFMCIFALGTGAWYSMSHMYKTFNQVLLTSFFKKAENLSGAIAGEFYKRYTDVQTFAENDGVRSMDPKLMQPVLNNFSPLLGLYDLIVVVDKKGNFIACNDKDLQNKPANKEALAKVDFTKAPWFQAAVNGQFTEEKSKGLVGTFFEELHKDPLFKEAFGEERFMTGFTSVIKNLQGEVIGVISNRTNPKWYEKEIVQFHEMEKNEFPSLQMTILNKDGFYLLQHSPQESDDQSIVKHDSNLLLKEKYFKSETEVSAAVAAKKSGFAIGKNPVTSVEEVIGYKYFSHARWPSSLEWTLLIHDPEAETFATANAALSNFYIVFFSISFIALIFSIWFGIKLSGSVEKITDELSKNSSDLSNASIKIASSATQLSESASEQAAALQETVTAVEQISSMIQKNSEAAQKSKDVSAQSRKFAEHGRATVENMLHAIDDIQVNNSEISLQMESTNKQLSEITGLINDIANKTKIINEIVFQTKLLSFNASVEAARAGEYGRGFAVVAEEVGNLAQMSGSAAKDISTMLEDSVGRVDLIIRNTKVKVEKLMSQSKEKVKAGSATAKDCEHSLNEILNSVQSVDQFISEIATASREQSSGVREISNAISQMENVTQQNSSVAQSSSVSSEQLRHQASNLNAIVDSLTHFVGGISDIHNAPKLTEVKKISTSAPAIKSNTVLEFTKPNLSKTPNVKQERVSFEKIAKKVGGSDISFPSADDPGFDEE